MRRRLLWGSLLCLLLGYLAYATGEPKISNKEHLSPLAWTAGQWQEACAGVRTSYNPNTELTDADLTLVPGDPRWLDFVF